MRASLPVSMGRWRMPNAGLRLNREINPNLELYSVTSETKEPRSSGAQAHVLATAGCAAACAAEGRA